ncbi:MFS transporter [Psychrobacter sp. I-STPA6b]|uniref:MFS transporter n=1 Tax=Psychrobacter sp. I-STPA6b TaxID=2585718 RepID=UPI001D0C040E|nr:MFS transporter [Psychrobacter sp. I-STPA6b]
MSTRPKGKFIPSTFIPSFLSQFTQYILGKSHHPVMLFASLSSAIAIFDFLIYISMADILATNFFPETSTILTPELQLLVLFAVGYFARPIGGIILGQYADTKGRKPALFISIFLTSISTLLMACLPTYAQIGILSPILLFISRIIQGIGFSVHAPLVWVFVAEHSPIRRLPLNCSYVTASFLVGILFSILFFTAFIGSMSQLHLIEYGWRIAFVFAALLNFITLLLWYAMDETPIFKKIQPLLHTTTPRPCLPIKRIFTHRLNSVFLCVMLTLVISSLFVVIVLTLPDIITLRFSLDTDLLRISHWIGIFFMVLGCLFYGLLANQGSQGRVLMIGCAILILQIFAFFYQLEYGGDFILIMYALLGFCTGVIGMIPAIMLRLFPADLRLTGLSFAYNTVYAVVGGILPFALVYAINYVSFSPALYVTFICLVGVIIGFYIARLPDFRKIDATSIGND